jgi:hypothetical protein
MRARLPSVLILLLALPALAEGAGPTPPTPIPRGFDPKTGVISPAVPPGSPPGTFAPVRTNPYDFPFPLMPWDGLPQPGPPGDGVLRQTGRVIRYLEVPPQDVTVELPVPSAETQPFRLEPQVVTIPGYVLAETENGYLYPQRWTLEQLNVGVYQWRLRPQEFRLK